mmetsp:Transcript_11907/g.32037  ORF Transcript_11907/g.32037 Transcript_11907/m.32037 type:complete len:437 (+) Transcript_11907:1136-2446(+)
MERASRRSDITQCLEYTKSRASAQAIVPGCSSDNAASALDRNEATCFSVSGGNLPGSSCMSVCTRASAYASIPGSGLSGFADFWILASAASSTAGEFAASAVASSSPRANFLSRCKRRGSEKTDPIDFRSAFASAPPVLVITSAPPALSETAAALVVCFSLAPLSIAFISQKAPSSSSLMSYGGKESVSELPDSPLLSSGLTSPLTFASKVWVSFVPTWRMAPDRNCDDSGRTRYSSASSSASIGGRSNRRCVLSDSSLTELKAHHHVEVRSAMSMPKALGRSSVSPRCSRIPCKSFCRKRARKLLSSECKLDALSLWYSASESPVTSMHKRRKSVICRCRAMSELCKNLSLDHMDIARSIARIMTSDLSFFAGFPSQEPALVRVPAIVLTNTRRAESAMIAPVRGKEHTTRCAMSRKNPSSASFPSEHGMSADNI